MRLAWTVLLALAAAGLVAVAVARPDSGPTFSIVFSKDVNGETEPCG